MATVNSVGISCVRKFEIAGIAWMSKMHYSLQLLIICLFVFCGSEREILAVCLRNAKQDVDMLLDAT